jgi:hypothetical protein
MCQSHCPMRRKRCVGRFNADASRCTVAGKTFLPEELGDCAASSPCGFLPSTLVTTMVTICLLAQREVALSKFAKL